MSFLITKADFPEYVPLSINIADNLIAPYIRDAYTFDVARLLSPAEWALVTAALDPDAAPAPAERLVWAALKPVWIFEAFRRFFLWHGTHVTPNSVEVIANDGNQTISSARRAELKADIEAKAAHYQRLLESVLRTYRGPLPQSTCTTARRRPSSGGLTTHAV